MSDVTNPEPFEIAKYADGTMAAGNAPLPDFSPAGAPVLSRTYSPPAPAFAKWPHEVEAETRSMTPLASAGQLPGPLHLPPHDVARVAHEINRAYCQAIGDFSQPKWDDAPEWQKQSAIKGVIFHRSHPNATPEASHESWMQEKLRDGWVEGPVKNPELKQHPCMVPYHMLPVEQRVKDHLFHACVHALSRFVASPVCGKSPAA